MSVSTPSATIQYDDDKTFCQEMSRTSDKIIHNKGIFDKK